MKKQKITFDVWLSLTRQLGNKTPEPKLRRVYATGRSPMRAFDDYMVDRRWLAANRAAMKGGV